MRFTVQHDAPVEFPHSLHTLVDSSAPSVVNTVMHGSAEQTIDPEQGPGGSVPLDEFAEESWSGTHEGPSDFNSGGRTTGDSSSECPSYASFRKERRDFDDGANALWSLYGKEAKTHDEAQIQRLAADMDGIPTFAGLFAGVITSFLVQSIQNLQVNPAEQSVYYQNQSVYYQQQSMYYQQQSVAILAQILQQMVSVPLQESIAPQVSTPFTIPPSRVPFPAQQIPIPSTLPPYPAFKPAISDVRVNAFWLASLVCVLSAVLLAIFVKQWVRSYMQVFEQYDHPLKRA